MFVRGVVRSFLPLVPLHLTRCSHSQTQNILLATTSIRIVHFHSTCRPCSPRMALLTVPRLLDSLLPSPSASSASAASLQVLNSFRANGARDCQYQSLLSHVRAIALVWSQTMCMQAQQVHRLQWLRFAKVLLLLEQLLQTQQIRVDDPELLTEEEAGSAAQMLSLRTCFQATSWQKLDGFHL